MVSDGPDMLPGTPDDEFGNAGWVMSTNPAEILEFVRAAHFKHSGRSYDSDSQRKKLREMQTVLEELGRSAMPSVKRLMNQAYNHPKFVETTVEGLKATATAVAVEARRATSWATGVGRNSTT